jgi:GH3 auxin-responsive promoter
MRTIHKCIEGTIKLANGLSTTNKKKHADIQHETLQKLLYKARKTKFGEVYKFEKILESDNAPQLFKQNIPLHTYETMNEKWWQMAYNGASDITWPGKIQYFALSSGTSGSSSKHIPVSKDMIRNIKKMGRKQMYGLHQYPVTDNVFKKGILMIGGSTNLHKNDTILEGDMSGISAANLPKWMNYIHYKPGKVISQHENWEARVEAIVQGAPLWDIAIICGVPSWVLLIVEKIITRYQLQSIHDIWPNFELYIHGGVSFLPYQNSFNALCKNKIQYMETYMASEGSFGFRKNFASDEINLVLNVGVYYEFLPFNDDNFNDAGELKPDCGNHILQIDEIKPMQPYALIISTCSGAWRYLIGDVIQFTNVATLAFKIAGRTKQFLNICGEHLSVDNMNDAINQLQLAQNIIVKEYCVLANKTATGFEHHWYLGCDEQDIDNNFIATILDENLKALNDDYAIERESVLHNVHIKLIPNHIFYDFLKSQGKTGAMIKFPRVLKNDTANDWLSFLNK